jgi:hypothetical protein
MYFSRILSSEGELRHWHSVDGWTCVSPARPKMILSDPFEGRDPEMRMGESHAQVRYPIA